MEIEKINLNKYNRAEHYRHYMQHKCSITVSTVIDVTNLQRYTRKNNLRTYPILLWVISNAVNAVPDCRNTIDSNGDLARYSRIDPAYIAQNNETKTIYCLSTPFTPDLQEFYKHCTYDIDVNNNMSMFPQGKTPKNTFSVSANAQLQFTSMSISVEKQPFAPIITLGRIYKKWFKAYLPICIQVNHACCDGYHIEQIINEIHKTIKMLK